jgi:hypothetical protein
VFTGTISFPRETGGRETDLKIASMAEEWLQETKARAMADIAASPNPCGPEEGKGMYTEIAYELFRPSPGLMGVLFTDRGHDGGARGWLGYTAYTFDLATGRILAPFDLFPDRPVAYAGLWAFVWNESCAKDPPRETLPRFYGGAACSGKAPPPPPDGFMEDAEELEDLGSLVLTEKGAALNIDPSSAWSWAEGPYRLEIPRTELVKWGANPDLWNGRKPADPTSPAAGGAPAAPAAEGPQASPASEGAPGAGTPALRADRPAGVTPSPAEGPAAAAPPLQPAASEGPASGGDAEPAPGTPGGARPGVPPVRPGG